jgi:GH15 family glucan-1,4-alpha-glucosidase
LSLRIEDYALIGNTRTAALVGNNGSIDWLCMPRFDSAACFAALLGGPANGHWSIAPRNAVTRVSRRYRAETLILETEFVTESGTAAVIDFMPIAERHQEVDVIRVVRGIRGAVPMRMQIVFRLDYGHIVPWVTSVDHGLLAIAGPDALKLRTPVSMRGESMTTVSEFTIAEGHDIPFTLTWYPSHEAEPGLKHPFEALRATDQWWRDWSSRCTITGPWRDLALRSLITLKALTYGPTGGIVAAPTTSLPEWIGGQRNWDYRFCWLRDATFTLYALLVSGYLEEARAWRQWLLRAAAGSPQDLQIMYGVAGERRLTESELSWLEGYAGSSPVRVGNAAHEQFQLDVYGEVMDACYFSIRSGASASSEVWGLLLALMEHLENVWDQPDEGIWEVRGPRRHFTHSKVMAWVAVDRAIKTARRAGYSGPLERWHKLRDLIHQDVCQHGFDPRENAFVQYYGGSAVDAATLMIPLVGFLPAGDARVIGTVEAIRRQLLKDGLVMRYRTESNVDGLPAGEGVFLPCSFWLVDNLVMTGHYDEAAQLFEQLAALGNDLGLFAEEYDPQAHRLLGNFPQAFTHVSLVNSVHNLALAQGPARHRSTD